MVTPKDYRESLLVQLLLVTPWLVMLWLDWHLEIQGSRLGLLWLVQPWLELMCLAPQWLVTPMDYRESLLGLLWLVMPWLGWHLETQG